MSDHGGGFSFFQDIHVKTDIRFDISISIRPITTKFGNQLRLGELTQSANTCSSSFAFNGLHFVI